MKIINNKRQDSIVESGIKIDILLERFKNDDMYMELIDALDTILENSLDSYHMGVFDIHLLNKENERNNIQ